ncbi:MAG: oligosaccharide flippase family protein, partial [Candidatus Eisenbacteria bacterium]
ALPSSAARVGRNTAFRLGAQAVSAVINVSAMMLLGGQLSAAGYGEYVFWYALVPVLASVADLGTGVVVTRAIARAPEDARRLLGDALLVRAAVAAVVLGGIAALVFPLLGAARGVLVLCVAAAALLDFSQDAAVWASRARERLDVEAVLLLVSQGVWLALIALALMLHATLPVLIATAAAAFALRMLAGGVWLARCELVPVFHFDRARAAALVGEGWPVALSLLLVVLYGRAGVFALKAWSSAGEVACFNVAYMLAQPFGFMASALALAVFPSVARLSDAGGTTLQRTLRSANKYQWLVSLPLAVGLSLLAARIVPLFFKAGAGFEHAAVGLSAVALALPFVFMNLQSRYLLAALGQQRVYLAAVAVGLLVNVAGCAWFVRSAGASGAAWTFLAAEAVVFAICQRAAQRRVGSTGVGTEALRPVLAAAVMAAVVVSLGRAPLALVIVLAVAVYAAVLALTGAWSRAESQLVSNILTSFRSSRAPHAAARREQS